MTVGVVCDGGVSLPESAAESIVTIPLQLDNASGYGDARGGARPTTAAPSPNAFLEAIRTADAGQGVLVVTVSSRLSSSATAACLAAEMAKAEGHRAVVLDSTSATVGEGLVALAVRRAADDGCNLAEVTGVGRYVAGKVRLVAAISDLDDLARSGRVPGLAVAATRITGLRPLFELCDGTIRPLRPVLGLPRAQRRIVEELARSKRPGHVLHVAVLQGAEQGSADRLLTRLSEIAPLETCFVAELSAVMLLHTGPGVSGLAWWWEER